MKVMCIDMVEVDICHNKQCFDSVNKITSCRSLPISKDADGQ